MGSREYVPIFTPDNDFENFFYYATLPNFIHYFRYVCEVLSCEMQNKNKHFILWLKWITHFIDIVDKQDIYTILVEFCFCLLYGGRLELRGL